MQVKRSTVEKIRIEGIERSHRLDPVEVIIENYGEGAGKILISCWGESWTGYWGSLGGTLEEFFQRVSNDYLINKMSDYSPTVPNHEEDEPFVKRMILVHRRKGKISKEEAKEAWWRVDSFGINRKELQYTVPESLLVLEGMCDPWCLDWPREENPKYVYLSRILDLVREVIKPEVKDES